MLGPSFPDLILGSAMWGWTLDAPAAFTLLDQFYAAGFRKIDGATNYPLNGVPTDFRGSENILAEWIKAHGVQDLEIIMKVGSISNQYSPEQDRWHLGQYSHWEAGREGM